MDTATPIKRRKVSSVAVADLLIDGADDIAVSFAGFSNVTISNVTIKNSPRGFKFHNGKNLTMSDCNVENVNGDAIYATRIVTGLFENNFVGTVSAPAADCCQFAYEKSDSNISKNIILRGNVFVQAPDSPSKKGALVFGRTQRYLVEYNVLAGPNFALSSLGDDAEVRSNVIRGGRLNNYSFGYGIGDEVAHSRHNVYDNLIENCNRGISLSGSGDKGLANRIDIDVHDNVISDCEIAFFADRPWSGRVSRNIFMRCKHDILVKSNGGLVASGGVYDGQTLEQNYNNDGSFLCIVPPLITLVDHEHATVSPGRWTSEPDEIRMFWRDRGQDIPGARRPSFVIQPDMQISCVILARKGENWMLSLAETEWPHGGFLPRSLLEGQLPWRRRYVDAMAL